jgi:hypothetical protein
MVREVLLSEYNETLKKKVHDAVAEKISEDFVEKIIKAGLRNY